jgi:hypothetical protein
LEGFAQGEIVGSGGAGDIDVAGGVERDGDSLVNAFAAKGVGEKELTVGVELGDEDVGAARCGVDNGRCCAGDDGENAREGDADLPAPDDISVAGGIRCDGRY